MTGSERLTWHLAWLVMATALTAGCATYPPYPSVRPPQPVDAAFAAYYAHTTMALTIHREPLSQEASSRWDSQRVTLEGEGMANPVRLDWYAPQPVRGRHAAVLIFPIMAGDDLGTRDFAQALARQGLHGIIVYRPKEKFSMDKPLGQIEEHLRTTVQQTRRAIDWIADQPTVDPTRLGSMGVSMGATMNILIASVEPRLSRYVFCLPASHVAHLVMTTKDRSIAKKRREYLRRYGLTPAGAEATLTELLRSEPLRVAGAIDPRRSLAVIALWDRVIGWRNSLDIWRALGRPQTIWLPTGHYTSLFALPYIKLRVLWFFQDWSKASRS